MGRIPRTGCALVSAQPHVEAEVGRVLVRPGRDANPVAVAVAAHAPAVRFQARLYLAMGSHAGLVDEYIDRASGPQPGAIAAVVADRRERIGDAHARRSALAVAMIDAQRDLAAHRDFRGI